jgi:hypothetical protein
MARWSPAHRLPVAASLLLLAIARPGFGDTPAAPPPPAASAVTVLPQVTVQADPLKDYHLFPPSVVTRPDFAPNAAPIDLFFPGKAYKDGITQGYATVGVELDEKGRPVDFLLIRYTQPYFGDSLMREAQRQTYSARQVMGMAVPGRFDFSNRFVPTMAVELNAIGAADERRDEVRGGPPYLYQPHLAKEVDGGELVITNTTYPIIPDNYAWPDGKPLHVLVSLYVDETGRVRLPNVESAPSPILIAHALEAVSHWSFKPPLIKGKPVLVFALWQVVFVPKSAVAKPQTSTG